MKGIWQRFELMIGEDRLNILNQKKVILFGVGGVGGYVAEMLVRSGICNLTVVDFDKVDSTNINRQVVALHSTIGKYKVDVMKDRLLDINPEANIVAQKERLSKETINKFDLSQYDFVIDCIDDIKAKECLILDCEVNNINLIVCCGAGNRYKNNPQFVVTDIAETSYDKVAKLLRKFCKMQAIEKLDVVWTKEQPIKLQETTIGSVAYYPASMACCVVSYVVNFLLKK